MPTLTVIQGDEVRHIPFEGSPILRQLLTAEGVPFAHPCGGRGQCGHCAVALSGAVSAPDEREQAAGTRLSCRARLLGDAEVRLPRPEPIRVEGAEGAGPFAGAMEEDLLGALDLGTTTVAMKLYRSPDGPPVWGGGCLNPQTAVAADVIGRVQAALDGRGESLRVLVRDAVRGLLAQARAAGVAGAVRRWVIAGNTAMLYLFTGRHPASLARAPFAADHLFDETILLEDGAEAWLPPCLHAFAGADFSCALFRSGLLEGPAPALLCDLGTNGEIALWTGDRLYAASAAMGPALEGAGIRCGCGAVPGAVDRVFLLGGAVRAETIGGGPARGLCGSGVIDAVACGLDGGWIDASGRMEAPLPIRDGVVLAPEDVRQVQLAKAALAAGIRRLMAEAGVRPERLKVCFLAGGFGSRLNLISAARIGLIPAGTLPGARILGNAALDGAAMLLRRENRDRLRTALGKAAYLPLGGDPDFNRMYMEEIGF